MKRRALLLGSSLRVIVTIARCLQRHGIESHVASLLPEQPPIRSRAVASFQYLPSEPVAFSDGLADLVQAQAIDFVYPCGDEALSLLIACEERIRPLVGIGCPSRATVMGVLDKSITLRAAATVGIPIPKDYVFDDIDAFRAAADSMVFPVIAKARSKAEAGGIRIRYYQSASELRAEFEHDPDFGRSVVIQEYVPGVGVGIEILMHDAAPLVLFQHRRLTELPITGGVSVRARAEPVDPVLAEYAVNLLRALHWNGVAMVEFRHDRQSGRLALMEVNGRYWGSLPLSFLAGVEFPWYEWQLAHGETPSPPPSYKLMTMRWLAGELQRVPQIAGEVLRRRMSPWLGLKELAAVPVGFFQPLGDALWARDDPTPFWDDLRHTWHSVLRPYGIQAAGRVFPPVKRRVAAVRGFGSLAAARIHDDLASGRTRHPQPPVAFCPRRLLILCHGNIMRSPFVEHVLGSLLAPYGMQVTSAGLGCIPGRPAEERAIRHARSLGIDLSRHRAQPVTRELLDDADAIMVMDYRNLAMLLDRWGDVGSKTYLLADWRGDRGGSRSVADPYTGDDQDLVRCYEELLDVSRNLGRVVAGHAMK